MRAAVLRGVGKMVVEDVPQPQAGSGEVIVRIKACGICQTDYSAYTGRRTNFTPPLILGHEMSGIVDEVGKGVEDFVPGDEVVILPTIQCGRCRYCYMDLPNHCLNGYGIGGEGYERVLDGGFAEYCKVPAKVLFRKPANITFEEAALTEPLAGCYKGLIQYSKLQLGEDLVIIGAGSMGLLLLEVGLAAGAGRVAVIDVVDSRLGLAKELGAHLTINSAREDPQQRLKEFMEFGPDLIVEAAGVMEAASLAFQLARGRSRINIFGVIIPGQIEISPAQVHFKEINMDASFSVTPHAMTRSLNLLERGLVDVKKIITHTFPLERIDEALETMGSEERVKVVIQP